MRLQHKSVRSSSPFSVDIYKEQTGLPYYVDISYDSDNFRGPVLFDEKRGWLESQVGKQYKDWIWIYVSTQGSGKSGPISGWRAEFKREEDKVKFILRWL